MKRVATYIVLLIVLLSVAACGTKRDFPDAPAEVERLAHAYLQAAGIGTKEAVKYIYFPEGKEELRQLFVDQEEQRLTSYEIQKIDKLRDDLYALTVEAQPSYEPEPFTLYNFIGKIDGKWYYLPSQEVIPNWMREGVDFSAYSYPNEEGGLLIRDYGGTP